MILITLKIPVRADRIEQWVPIAQQYARDVAAEEGALFFEWSRSLEDPNTFVCVEGFRDAPDVPGYVPMGEISPR